MQDNRTEVVVDMELQATRCSDDVCEIENIMTSLGFGECISSSATFSLTPTTLASMFCSNSRRLRSGFLLFQMGEAVMPNILGFVASGQDL